MGQLSEVIDRTTTRSALTPRQAEVVDVIRKSLEARGHAPSVRTIGATLYISAPTVQEHLDALEAKGAIRRDGSAYGIELLEPALLLGPVARRDRPSRAGFVYLLGNAVLGWYKIGNTMGAAERAKCISVELPFSVELVHSVETNDRRAAERVMHDRFSGLRLNGEWFQLTPEHVDWFCMVERLDVDDAEGERKVTVRFIKEVRESA